MTTVGHPLVCVDLEGLQVLDEVSLLRVGEPEGDAAVADAGAVVVVDDVQERGKAAIMEEPALVRRFREPVARSDSLEWRGS